MVARMLGTVVVIRPKAHQRRILVWRTASTTRSGGTHRPKIQHVTATVSKLRAQCFCQYRVRHLLRWRSQNTAFAFTWLPLAAMAVLITSKAAWVAVAIAAAVRQRWSLFQRHRHHIQRGSAFRSPPAKAPAGFQGFPLQRRGLHFSGRKAHGSNRASAPAAPPAGRRHGFATGRSACTLA